MKLKVITIQDSEDHCFDKTFIVKEKDFNTAIYILNQLKGLKDKSVDFDLPLYVKFTDVLKTTNIQFKCISKSDYVIVD